MHGSWHPCQLCVVFCRALLEIWRAAINAPSLGTITFPLVFFGFGVPLLEGHESMIVSPFTDVLPSIKLCHQFVMHCSPLVGSYLLWSLYKANDTPQA
jgi:hypothetical protein